MSIDSNKKNEWIKSNKIKLQYQLEFTKTLSKIASNIPPCNKCYQNSYQIWGMYGSNQLEIRCTTCKKKRIIDISKTATEFSLTLTNYIELVQYMHKEGVWGTELGVYLKNHFRWDFINLRKDTPFIRAITFNGNSTIIEEQIPQIEPKRTRRITQKVKDLVWNRDGGKCVECGSNENLEFDHIIPFSKGGANTYRNIQLLCENCNRSKSAKIG